MRKTRSHDQAPWGRAIVKQPNDWSAVRIKSSAASVLATLPYEGDGSALGVDKTQTSTPFAVIVARIYSARIHGGETRIRPE